MNISSITNDLSSLNLFNYYSGWRIWPLFRWILIWKQLLDWFDDPVQEHIETWGICWGEKVTGEYRIKLQQHQFWCIQSSTAWEPSIRSRIFRSEDVGQWNQNRPNGELIISNLKCDANPAIPSRREQFSSALAYPYPAQPKIWSSLLGIPWKQSKIVKLPFWVFAHPARDASIGGVIRPLSFFCKCPNKSSLGNAHCTT